MSNKLIYLFLSMFLFSVCLYICFSFYHFLYFFRSPFHVKVLYYVRNIYIVPLYLCMLVKQWLAMTSGISFDLDLKVWSIISKRHLITRNSILNCFRWKLTWTMCLLILLPYVYIIKHFWGKRNHLKYISWNRFNMSKDCMLWTTLFYQKLCVAFTCVSNLGIWFFFSCSKKLFLLYK